MSYAITFDLDTKRMKEVGFSKADITKIYQTELPNALAKCGFTRHPQGSVYCTSPDEDQITAVMNLEASLRTFAPKFCRYVRAIYIFRMDEWSDITHVFAKGRAGATPGEDDGFEEQNVATLTKFMRTK